MSKTYTKDSIEFIRAKKIYSHLSDDDILNSLNFVPAPVSSDSDIDEQSLYDLLCPIDDVTGVRQNSIQNLSKLPESARNSILQNIASLRANVAVDTSSLSADDIFKLIPPRSAASAAGMYEWYQNSENILQDALQHTRQFVNDNKIVKDDVSSQ